MSLTGGRVLAVLRVERGEASALFWSWAYIFTVLASYYMLRPIRDQMGLAGECRTCRGSSPRR